MVDLQAWVDCLLKENGKLRSQVATWEVQVQEAKTLKAIVFEDLVRAREDRDKAVSISLKFHDFVGHLSNVVNKTRLFDKSAGQLGASPASKVIRCLVDYNAKMEKLLREMQTLLQPAGQ